MEEIAELSDGIVALDIRIDDFFTATERVSEDHLKRYNNCIIQFSATAFPYKDRLSVSVYVTINPPFVSYEVKNIKWAVSIVDIDGRTRFTRYFQTNIETYSSRLFKDVSEQDRLDSLSLLNKGKYKEETYLEKSFILERADELLSGGALLLSCEIYSDFSRMEGDFYSYCQLKFPDIFDCFLKDFRKRVWYKKAAGTGNLRDTFARTVFDLTEQVLTLPQFHESRKRFGVYGIPLVFAKPVTESEEDITDNLEHVWIFDTRPDRFLLSLAPKPFSVGRLLVDASPVIRRCIEVPMREQREKRIEFPDVDSLTFRIVLHCVQRNEVSYFLLPFNKAVDVYLFSHLYEMEYLQRICAEYLTRNYEDDLDLEEIGAIAELHSDGYLLQLLQSRKIGFSERPGTLVKDDRANFECYI